MNEEKKNIEQSTTEVVNGAVPQTQIPQPAQTEVQQQEIVPQTQVPQPAQTEVQQQEVVPQTKVPQPAQTEVQQQEVVPQTKVPQPAQSQVIQQTPTEAPAQKEVKEEYPSLLKEQDPSSTPTPEKTDKESNKSLILIGVFFIIMFAFIMFLPTINSYVTKLKEKQLENQIVDPVEKDNKDDNQDIPGNTNGKEVKVVCTSKETTMVDTSTMSIKYTYTHIDDKVKKVEKEVTYKYQTSESESYTEQEKKCDNEIKLNNNQAGYNATCTLEENKIIVTENFDLVTFKTFTSTTGNTISPVTDLDTSLKEEVKELTNQGYTCE